MTKSAANPQVSEMAPNTVSAARPENDPEELDFDHLFSIQFQYVWGALRRLGIPPRDLEDVTHDVFLRVYRQRHLYDPARPVRPWLFAFAFRVASDYRRLARHRREVLEPVSENADPTPTAVDELLRAEMLCVGYAALETLELGRRAVFILYELDGCSMQEVALALDIPVNTAYSRLRLAREQFQASLARMRLARGTR